MTTTDERMPDRLYMNTISSYKPLARERELELSTRIQAGDLSARNELVEANLLFVIHIAKGYQGKGLELVDLISAGNGGLITAAERFEGERGFKFISYAVWWIRQGITAALLEHSRTVRMPGNSQATMRAVTRTTRRLEQETQRGVTTAEALDAMGATELEEEQTHMWSQPITSLDGHLFDDNGDLTMGSTLAADDDMVEQLELCDYRNRLEGLLSVVDARKQQVLIWNFGLGGRTPQTLTQIGQVMGVTRERIRQLKEQALEEIRDHAEATGLVMEV